MYLIYNEFNIIFNIIITYTYERKKEYINWKNW